MVVGMSSIGCSMNVCYVALMTGWQRCHLRIVVGWFGDLRSRDASYTMQRCMFRFTLFWRQRARNDVFARGKYCPTTKFNPNSKYYNTCKPQSNKHR